MSARKFQSFVFRQIGRLLDPNLCPGCQQGLATPQTFCDGCLQKLPMVKHPCQLCGLENQTTGDVCAACLYDPPRWQKIIAPLVYQGLARELLIQLKFSDSLYLANKLVDVSIDNFRQAPRPQVLLPVPLHTKRFIDRGYNQAFEVANILSQRLGIDVDTQCLQRTRHTDTQAGLSAYKRQKNILKAFSCDNAASYQHVAVVDDIVTTGSTANEVTKTLHRAGVKTVEIWGLARVLK